MVSPRGLVRRITGRTIGAFFAAEIAAPLDLEWWIGLPEHLEPRLARIVPPSTPTDPEVRELMDAIMAPGTLMGDALTGPANHFRYDEMWNTRTLHECELPSSNGPPPRTASPPPGTTTPPPPRRRSRG